MTDFVFDYSGNYARAHWMKSGESPSVGLNLCAQKGASEAYCAPEASPNKVLAAEYQSVLPDEKLSAEELARTRLEQEARQFGPAGDMEGGE